MLTSVPRSWRILEIYPFLKEWKAFSYIKVEMLFLAYKDKIMTQVFNRFLAIDLKYLYEINNIKSSLKFNFLVCLSEFKEPIDKKQLNL